MGSSANQAALVTDSSRGIGASIARQLAADGLGEVAMVGVAAAIGNAIFHATGRRLREPPIRIEHLF